MVPEVLPKQCSTSHLLLHKLDKQMLKQEPHPKFYIVAHNKVTHLLDNINTVK
jgi:hypothetical protein